MLPSVGAIVNRVSTSAIPTSTIFGGACWVPMAVRRKENTTTYRVKEVIITTSDGKSVMTVSSSIMSSASTLPPLTLINADMDQASSQIISSPGAA